MADGRPPPGYIDVHTHADRIRDSIYIFNAAPDQTSPIGHHARISIGLHPWSLEHVEPESALATVAEFASHPSVLAIGECGLDRLIATPLDQQIHWFRMHLDIAERVGKPVIVHCVRAHNELVRLLKATKVDIPVIIHGYNNNPQIAGHMLRSGIMLSFGATILQPRAPVRSVLAMCPEEKFFLETDDSNVEIEAIYGAAAECRKVGLTALQEQMERNFKRHFAFGSDLSA